MLGIDNHCFFSELPHEQPLTIIRSIDVRFFNYTLIAGLLVLAACSDNPEGPVATTGGDAPTFSKSEVSIDLKDRYIVVFKDDVGNPNALTDQLMEKTGGRVHFRYAHAIKGFAATLPAQALEGIRHNPNVDYIEADGIVTITTNTQNNPPSWGLDRVDQVALPLNQQYIYQNDGADVTVYIIDTGIRMDHSEYFGRASSGWDFVDGDADADDCHGHGTHVAGTVGGDNVGLAKGVNLVAVRVLNCSGSGTWSGVIAGIDWVTLNHTGASVANMSLGGGYSSSINQAVNNSVTSGVVYAVSAGNSNALACNYSPASAADALTVASSTSSDARSSFSNYGTCVDIFAPGSGIYSSTMSSTSSYASWSGTSMASPHVAGAAALYLAANPSKTPAEVEIAIESGATSGVLSNIGTGSPNLLLYSLIAGSSGPVPSAPSGLALSNVTTNSIDLAWTDNSNDENGFKIQRSLNNVNWSDIATVAANTTGYSNTGLSSNTTYYYRVNAFNANGSSGYSNTESATTQSIPSTIVHVGDLDEGTPASWQVRNSWYAQMIVTVLDAGNSPESGVTVSVSWGNKGASAVTNASGQCTITTSRLNYRKTASVTMTVDNLSGPGITYNSSANSATSLTINRPPTP